MPFDDDDDEGIKQELLELAERGAGLSGWEAEFCESAGRWEGRLTEAQRMKAEEVLERHA